MIGASFSSQAIHYNLMPVNAENGKVILTNGIKRDGVLKNLFSEETSQHLKDMAEQGVITLERK